MLKRMIIIAGIAMAVPAAQGPSSEVTAPGGLSLGLTVDSALKSSAGFFYGDTCFGERAVSGDILTDDGFVHVMGYVDESARTINSVEAIYLNRRSVATVAQCESHVRAMASERFPGIDWRGAKMTRVFLGGADRVHMAAMQGGIAYEAWGDVEAIIGLQCILSWRASHENRRFDIKRLRPY